MLVTAVCFLFLLKIKLKRPKNNDIYELFSGVRRYLALRTQKKSVSLCYKGQVFIVSKKSQ